MSSLDPRIRKALANASHEAGGYLISAPDGKEPLDIEKRCRAKMMSVFRSAGLQMSEWGDRRSEKQVVLCPVDSILNLSRQHGPLGVMAAYLDQGEPLVGCIFLPKHAEFIIAEKGGGAFLQDARVRVNEKEDITRAIIRCDNAENSEQIGYAIQALIESGVEWQNFGSPAEAFVSVIRGKADGYFSPCMDPFHIGGYLVMDEAGVVVTDSKGDSISMDSKNVVAARPGIHEQLLEIIGRIL